MELIPVITELNSIKNEIKKRNIELRDLRTRKSGLENTIQNYLESHNKTGIKYQGVTYSCEPKKRRVRKKEAEKRDDTINALTSRGLKRRDANELYKVMKESMKGREEISSKLESKSRG